MSLQARLLPGPPSKEHSPVSVNVSRKLPSSPRQHALREQAHVNLTDQLDVDAHLGACSHGDDANLARV
jgi:hypothetical protein